jgi:hypothetical protein
MTMYLVLSAFTSSPISLAAATKASVFFCTACTWGYFTFILLLVSGLTLLLCVAVSTV